MQQNLNNINKDRLGILLSKWQLGSVLLKLLVRSEYASQDGTEISLINSLKVTRLRAHLLSLFWSRQCTLQIRCKYQLFIYI